MRYVIRIWLMTVLLSPVVWQLLLVALGFTTFDRITSVIPDVYPLLFIGGLLISIPVFCAFYLFYNKVLQQPWKMPVRKIVLSLSGILLIALTFFLLDSTMLTRPYFTLYSLLLSYMIVMVSIVWASALPSVDPEDLP